MLSQPAYALPHTKLLEELASSLHGLTPEEAKARQARYGANMLPTGKVASLGRIFIRQFLNPLIYVLVAAAIVSLALDAKSDAVFIAAVLLLNAVIGTIQEYHAAKSAEALRNLLDLHSFVIRGGEEYEIDARDLVPGDIVLLESGAKVPADLRLCTAMNLEIDESLLTGESVSVAKSAEPVLGTSTPLADRDNMAFAGALVTRGRAVGVVTATGLHTEVGKIASSVISTEAIKPPLLLRMEKFTQRIAVAIGIAVVLLAGIAVWQGMPWSEIFTVSVALAVAAIPEGLPVALTIALAISLRRMAKRNVIVRKLVAVEALGSCTFIASDKTGTLTLNQLTLHRVALPGLDPVEVTGEGIVPEGELRFPPHVDRDSLHAPLADLALAGTLCNEGFLGKRDGEWATHGDAVDIALLVFAHKLGITRGTAEETAPEIASIPFESDRQFAATLHQIGSKKITCVKGAYERILPMCALAGAATGKAALAAEAIHTQATQLAEAGYKVIALAKGEIELQKPQNFAPEHLQGLHFLGLVGMIDPLRPEAMRAVTECHAAGIELAMVTGDHPVTALAIARELRLADTPEQIITGAKLHEVERETPSKYREFVLRGRVFARVEPEQKLKIIRALRETGHFVAVTGDGVNDAPAMRAAHVSVAMGKRGTDIARETAELILTDDNFASIIAGIEEGRVAYANVRKVIYFLASTGGASIFLFFLSMTAGLPAPLLAVQLLWFNLVTSGIQDVALAFEPAEGDELKRPPRSPHEPIFDRSMLERCILAALVIGGIGFGYFAWSLKQGTALDEARNQLLLLMVLFSNLHVGNARSELGSSLQQNPFRNSLLLFGTLAAQLIHIAAMFTPGLREILGITPVAISHWFVLLGTALSIWFAMEIYKLMRRRRPIRKPNTARQEPP